MVELDDPAREHERVVIGQRRHAGAEADALRSLGSSRAEHLGRGDNLDAAGVVLADPRLIIIQPVQMLKQLEIALERQRRVFVPGVERRQKDAALEGRVHFRSPDRPVVSAKHRPLMSAAHRGFLRESGLCTRQPTQKEPENKIQGNA